MVMSWEQNSGRNHSIQTDKNSFEKMEHFRFLETAL
jgi:hypothetical protein